MTPQRCDRCCKVLPAGATFCPRCGGRVGPVEMSFESSAVADEEYLDDDEELPEGTPPRQARYATTNALKYVLKSGRVDRGRSNRPLAIPPQPPPAPTERAMPVLDYAPKDARPYRPPPPPATPRKKSNWPLWVVAFLAVQMVRVLMTSNRSSSPTPTPSYNNYTPPKWKPTPSPAAWKPAPMTPPPAATADGQPIPGTSLSVDNRGHVVVNPSARPPTPTPPAPPSPYGPSTPPPAPSGRPR